MKNGILSGREQWAIQQEKERRKKNPYPYRNDLNRKLNQRPSVSEEEKKEAQ
jgi:hypothetical protein